MFEFNPTLVMEDDDDNDGEVFVHYYDKVTIWEVTFHWLNLLMSCVGC